MNWAKDDLPLESSGERERRTLAELNPFGLVMFFGAVLVLGYFGVAAIVQGFGPYFSNTVVPFYAVTPPGGTAAKSTSSLNPGRAYSTKSFNLWVPEDYSIEFSTRIGSEYGGKSVEDPGTLYCVVPICVENKVKETESFTGVTWYLHTADGYRFEIHSMADMYRNDSEKLNPYDIPPGITRRGGLVFLVTDKAKDSRFLTLEADGFSFTARFELQNDGRNS